MNNFFIAAGLWQYRPRIVLLGSTYISSFQVKCTIICYIGFVLQPQLCYKKTEREYCLVLTLLYFTKFLRVFWDHPRRFICFTCKNVAPGINFGLRTIFSSEWLQSKMAGDNDKSVVLGVLLSLLSLKTAFPISKKYMVNQGCLFWSMAAMLGNSVVMLCTRPQAIMLAMVTKRQSTCGFPFLSYMSMGLRMAALRAAGAPLLTLIGQGFTIFINLPLLCLNGGEIIRCSGLDYEMITQASPSRP